MNEVIAELTPAGVLRRSPSGYPSSVLGKAFRVLEAFKGVEGALGLTALSQRAGVPKATVHRLAIELCSLGMLEREGERYLLGWGVRELARHVHSHSEILAAARPLLLDLRAETNAIVHLSVQQGLEVCFLERLVGRKEAHVLGVVRDREPCLATASGRVLVALNSLNMPHSPGIRIASSLRIELEEIRRRKWAEECEERVPGLKTYAVPVTTMAGRALAAVSATVPVESGSAGRLLCALRSVAGEIVRELALLGESDVRCSDVLIAQ